MVLDMSHPPFDELTGELVNLPFNAQIGLIIRHCRTGCGLSQTALGRKIGITFQQIQKYESGKNGFNVERLFQMARAMEVSPGWIISLLEKNWPPDHSRMELAVGLPFRLRQAVEAVRNAEDQQLLFLIAQRLAK